MEWKNMSKMQKIMLVIASIAAFLVVVAMRYKEIPTYPFVAVFTLCEAMLYWKKERKWAYIMIVGAIISIVCFMSGL